MYQINYSYQQEAVRNSIRYKDKTFLFADTDKTKENTTKKEIDY